MRTRSITVQPGVNSFIPGFSGTLSSILIGSPASAAGAATTNVSLAPSIDTQSLPPERLLQGAAREGTGIAIVLNDIGGTVVIPVELPIWPTTAVTVECATEVMLTFSVKS